jgi:hypothetical protein
VVRELELGWGGAVGEEFKDRFLWPLLQTRDERAGWAVDWDPFIAFVEFLHLRRQPPPAPPPVGLSAAARRRPASARPGAGERGLRARRLRPSSAAGGGDAEGGGAELSKGERECIEAWLAIDTRLAEVAPSFIIGRVY